MVCSIRFLWSADCMRSLVGHSLPAATHSLPKSRRFGIGGVVLKNLWFSGIWSPRAWIIEFCGLSGRPAGSVPPSLENSAVFLVFTKIITDSMVFLETNRGIFTCATGTCGMWICIMPVVSSAFGECTPCLQNFSELRCPLRWVFRYVGLDARGYQNF